MNKHFKDNVVFILVATAAFLSEPTIANAQTDPYSPVNFTEPLSLYRGKISPISPDSLYLNDEDRCNYMINEWGWGSCDGIEALIFGLAPGIDTVMVETPNSEGYVKFDDWEDADRQDEIDTIWNEFAESAKEQGKALGESIVPVRWYVQPTLNKEKSYLYYAILIDWEGEIVINAKASLFDRNGYVAFRLTPESSSLSESELQRLVEISLDAYQPEAKQAYFDFQDGDKVAAVGAIGVLATLVGVKYGKAAATGFVAILLLFLKKAWFVLLIPLVFLKKLFTGKKEAE
ncbi:MAG: DUF2167 domain-containing protein [Alphaproteobacteria bacterium]|jgi:uncharacterized membrane-anchored protein|nr:DUF2167 domain-containing protein [Alphaproteobacteria bacterium]